MEYVKLLAEMSMLYPKTVPTKDTILSPRLEPEAGPRFT